MWNELNPCDDLDNEDAARMWAKIGKDLGRGKVRRMPTPEESAAIAKRLAEIRFEKGNLQHSNGYSIGTIRISTFDEIVYVGHNMGSAFIPESKYAGLTCFCVKL